MMTMIFHFDSKYWPKYGLLCVTPNRVPMVTYVLRNARPADAVEVDDATPAWFERPLTDRHVQAMACPPGGYAWVILGDGWRPQVAFGVTGVAKHVASAWLVATPEATERQLRNVGRIIRQHLPAVARAGGWQRVEVMSPSTRPGQDRWLTFMGFCYEGTKKAWGSNRAPYDVWTFFPE